MAEMNCQKLKNWKETCLYYQLQSELSSLTKFAFMSNRWFKI